MQTIIEELYDGKILNGAEKEIFKKLMENHDSIHISAVVLSLKG